MSPTYVESMREHSREQLITLGELSDIANAKPYSTRSTQGRYWHAQCHRS